MRAGEGILVWSGMLLAAAVACGVEYDVVVLNPDAACVAVSDGQQAGCMETAGGRGERHPHAVIWLDAAQGMADLNPEGCLASQVWDACGGRQVGLGDDHALLWSGTAESVVDLNPVGCEYSCAYGLWGSRQVGVGMSESVGERALLWSGAAESVVDLHPPGFAASRAGGLWGRWQVGYGVPQGGGEADWQALLWFGTAESVVNLHPSGFRWSCACDTWGPWQVGSGAPADGEGMQALLWSGAAESVVNLHPDGYRWSYIVRCWGDRQVGVGDDHALLWSGSAESVVDLHRFVPAEYAWSGAFGIDSTGRIGGYVGNDAGRRAAVWVPRCMPVYRCRSTRQSGCLYTTHGAEVESLVTDPNAWVFEGVFCHVPPDSLDPNAMPVYRFRARDGLARFYTIDRAERDEFFRDRRNSWTYEEIAFYAYRPSRRPVSAVAVHRFRSNSLGSYLYTRDERERAQLGEQNSGWIDEGVAWYACE